MTENPTRQIWAHLLTETAKAHLLACPPCRTLNPCVVGQELVASMATFLDATTETQQ